MHVIPVLDLADSVVVLAKGGRREDYRPIDTPLCPDPTPLLVVESMLKLFPFDKFYIADLDSIEGKSSNANSIVSLAHSYPAIEYWIDAGFRDVKDLLPYSDTTNIRIVIGSESLHSLNAYIVLCQNPQLDGHILSLDQKDGFELGSSGIVHKPYLWPDTIISMDLTRVGQTGGPNLERIRNLGAKRAGLDIVAAGGIRDIDDLIDLKANGVNHALVATALHNGKLRRSDLERLC